MIPNDDKPFVAIFGDADNFIVSTNDFSVPDDDFAPAPWPPSSHDSLDACATLCGATTLVSVCNEVEIRNVYE